MNIPNIDKFKRSTYSEFEQQVHGVEIPDWEFRLMKSEEDSQMAYIAFWHKGQYLGKRTAGMLENGILLRGPQHEETAHAECMEIVEGHERTAKIKAKICPDCDSPLVFNLIPEGRHKGHGTIECHKCNKVLVRI